MTREEARVLAHKLLGKWAKEWCVERGDVGAVGFTDDELHAGVCDTVTDNVLSGEAFLIKKLGSSGRPPGW